MKTKTKTPLVPSWVHTLDDYRLMFGLSESDLTRSILDYPAGVSSFNAEMRNFGHRVTSGDSHYNLKPLDMSKYVDNIILKLATQLDHYSDRIQEEGEKTLENILNAWNQSAQAFLADYSQGQLEGRYRYATPPKLPFGDFEFDLALCPDLLFRSKPNLSDQIITELCRVAHEVRVFPLLNEQNEISDILGPIMLKLQENNYGVEVREVPYQLQKGSNAMLRIWAKKCEVNEKSQS